MARTKESTVVASVNATSTPPSFGENAAARGVMAVGSGDCALVRGALAGLELIEFAAQKRDARVAELVAYYKAS